MSDVVERARAALEGVTPAPWEPRTAPYREDETLPVATVDKAEYLSGTLIGDGEPLHVLVAASPDLKFAYIVPAVTGDGPTSEENARFIAAARTLVPELMAEVERLRLAVEEAWDDGNATGLDGWIGPGRGAGEIDNEAVYARERCFRKLVWGMS